MTQGHGRMGLSETITDLINTADDENITAAESRIQALFRTIDALPTTWRWNATTPEWLRLKIEGLKSADAINAVYWHDLIHGAETYSVMTLWRIGEIMESALTACNADQVLSCTVLGRSLLEISAGHLRLSGQLRNLVEEILVAPRDALLASTEMEEALLRRAHGTRLGEPAEEYKAYQVLSDIDKIAKWKRGAKLRIMYDTLCEVAHPNTLGFQRFTDNVLRDASDGAEVIELARRSRGSVSTVVLHAALWSLGWSAQAALDGHAMVMTSRDAIDGRWPAKSAV